MDLKDRLYVCKQVSYLVKERFLSKLSKKEDSFDIWGR